MNHLSRNIVEGYFVNKAEAAEPGSGASISELVDRLLAPTLLEPAPAVKPAAKKETDGLLLVRQHFADLGNSGYHPRSRENREKELCLLFATSARPYPTEEMFRKLITRVLMTRRNHRRLFANQQLSNYGDSAVIPLALKHKKCPPDLIRLGAISYHRIYRAAALSNPRCPDEVRIESWLTFGEEQ